MNTYVWIIVCLLLNWISGEANLKSIIICEDDNGQIRCNTGKELIHVTRAIYGRYSTRICPRKQYNRINCGYSSADQVIKTKCNNKPSCFLFSTNNAFKEKDPCGGTSKYLKVDYTCEPCPLLAYCANTTCYNKHHVTCDRCVDKNLYKLAVGDTKCLRKCSYDNRWCWPGNCPNEFETSCTCATGFIKQQNENTTRCQPTQKPEIAKCFMEAIAANGDIRQSKFSGTSECKNQQDFYGRFQVDHLKTSLTYKFTVTLDKRLLQPGFVGDYVFGITDGDVQIIKINLTGHETKLSTKQLKQDINSENPEPVFHADNVKLPIGNITALSDGERLCLRFHARGGGHLVSSNSGTLSNHSYEKTEYDSLLCYIYDSAKPVHCLSTNTCTYDPLIVNRPITKDRRISVSFSGWTDPIPKGARSEIISGIESYEISLLEIKKKNESINFADSKAIKGTYKMNSSIHHLDITLPDTSHPAMYAIQLAVKDFADNTRLARRFVLYDYNSSISTKESKQIKVTTASILNNGKVWQTYHGKICFSWKNKYFNPDYQRNNILGPITGDDHGDITGVYEQTDGELPVSGTTNVDGITNFKFSFRKDGSDNQSCTFFDTPYLTKQSICFSRNLTDGDTYVLYLQAIDIMNHTFNDNTTVYIDASVPDINNIWLVKDGHKQLFVHGTKDLSSMFLTFEAFDKHSGIQTIEWMLGSVDGGSDIGRAYHKVTTRKSCGNEPSCYCPLVGSCETFIYTTSMNKLIHNNTNIGDHNRQYFFTITATNNAGLTSVEHLDILVDDSPPEPGTVLEGPIDGPDIDYTDQDFVITHWHGFIDHESGIDSYVIGVSDHCLSMHEMINQSTKDNSLFLESKATAVIVPLNRERKHFVTVIAYNNGMEPSNAVCSDGISRDLSIPVIVNVTLQNAHVADSIGCSNGIAWFIHNAAIKVRLIQTYTCTNRCLNSSVNYMIEAMGETLGYNKSHADISVANLLCSRMQNFNESIIYLPTDTVNLSWDIKDESQIHEVFVGFGSSPFTTNVVSYMLSKHVNFYKKQHIGLGSGSKIYCFLKVVNKAGLETILPYGPLLIDETPPVCPTSLPVQVVGDKVLLTWNNETFLDFEQKEQIGSIMFQIGNDHGIFTPFLEWNIIESERCINVTGGCITYPMDKLQQHNTEDGLSFFSRIHAYNYAGHFCVVESKAFYLPSMSPPGNGYVIDLYMDKSGNDIDISFQPYMYCASWNGFCHHKNIEFLIGVGVNHGTDDVIGFKPINATNSYCEKDTSLTFGRHYFVTVIAKCSGGIANASSDGFYIMDKQTISKEVHVYDGIGCTDDATVYGVSDFSTTNTQEFRPNKDLHIGKHYTLIIPNWNGGQFRIHSNESLFKFKETIAPSLLLTQNKTVFIPLVNKPLFIIEKFVDATTFSETIFISDCETEMSFLAIGSQVAVNWRVPAFIVPSHIIITLVQRCKNVINEPSYCDTVMYSTVVDGSRRFHEFDVLYELGSYYFKAEICFGQHCLDPKQSDGFVSKSAPSQPKISLSTLDKKSDCTELNLQWQSENSDSIFYRFGIFRNTDVRNNLTDMFIYHPTEYHENHLVKTCIHIPVYLHSKLFACVQEFDLSGLSTIACKEVEAVSNPNDFSSKVVYDVDMNSPGVVKLLKTLHSSYIGERLSKLHTYELDFAQPTTVLGAIVIGRGDLNTEWFLMTTPRVPMNCYSDSECIDTDITTRGFVKFNRVLIPDNVYYICAVSTVNSTDGGDDFNACSDGVLIDNTRPIAGKVTIRNKNGYITNRKEIDVSWEGFSDSKLYSDLGYGNGIEQYQYALGTYPQGRDVMPFTNVLYSTNMILRNLNLTAGFTYYLTIKAIDYVGLSTVVVSNGVILDSTPPVSGMIHVGDLSSHAHYLSTRNINIYWMGFHDDESGISTFQLGIGTKSYLPDIVSFKNYSQGYAKIEIESNIDDGRKYFAIITVYNGAGLTTTVASTPFILYSSPPITGKIYQGITNKKENYNYQLNTTTIHCHWYAFHDPHSHIRYYRVGLGREPLESDVVRLVNVGLQKEMTWHHHFQPGTRYYIVVEACNGAKLCQKASSTGIIIDNSPPIAGLVHVGMTGQHSKYVPQRTSLQAQWVGFEDPQSDIDHYEVCVGTKQNRCDVMPRRNFLLSASMTKTNINLPSGTPLYVSVRAFNKVGLYVDVPSDSFIVDNTPPIAILKPTLNFQSDDQYIQSDIQIDPSIIHLTWNFSDDESYVARQYLTLKTHHNVHTPVEQFDILPSASSLLLQLNPKSWLTNGDLYFAVITACNAAELCTSVKSSNLLIDSSPPLTGGLKHPLTWKSVSSNGTSVTRISLTWYGYSDVESNVSSYKLSVSTDYSQTELSGGFININHTGGQRDDQFLVFDLKIPLKENAKIILSVWAINRVGLMSRAAKTTVAVISKYHDDTSGLLEIVKHSCDTFYCTKECTCSVFGKVCAHIQRNDTCDDLGHLNNLENLIKVTIRLRDPNLNVSPSSACLSATWKTCRSSKLVIKRYEWSIGIKNGNVGEQIFDALTESIWHDVGMNTHVVYCLPRGKSLQHSSEYVFYIRAWFSQNQFRVYESQPTLIDMTGPSVRKGMFVMDSDSSCRKDLQYTKDTRWLSACWRNVFRDKQSDIFEFKVSLGTAPGGDDIKRTVSVGLDQNITWNGLSLLPGTKYYSTVTAINRIGLKTSISSNGILVDFQPPIVGVVFNTDKHHNVQFQHSSSTLKASWHGFTDQHSFIRLYEITLLKQINNGTLTIVPFKPVGIRTNMELRLSLLHGHRYFVGVKARDAAGFESETVFSPSVLVDITPPLAFQCQHYRQIFNMHNTTVTSVWHQNITLTKDSIYRLKLVLSNMTDGTVVQFSLGQMSLLLPISLLADGKVESVYDFISPENGSTNVKLNFHNYKVTYVSSMSISKCTSSKSNNSSALVLRQLSADKVSVCVNTFDPESGIKVVDIGAGTTKGGFQIRSLKPLELHNHMILDVMVPHATPVFVTAIAYNHAGLSSHYDGSGVIIDHTPPDIWGLDLTISYNLGENNDKLVNIRTEWQAKDIETGVQYCFCALGTAPLLFNIQNWRISTTEFECISENVEIPHGTHVYGSVKCVNHIELVKMASTKSETVLYLPPDPSDSKPAFIHEGPGSNVQKNTSTILVTWDAFKYATDNLQYECRITNENQTLVTKWKNVGHRTATLIDHLRMKDGQYYFAEIRASAVRHIASNKTKFGILIESRSPEMTDQPVTVMRMGDKIVTLNWENVFRSREGLSMTYEVTVGSMATG